MKQVFSMLAIAMAFVGSTITAKAELKTVSFDASASNDEVTLCKKGNTIQFTSEDGVKFTIRNNSGVLSCLSFVAPSNKKVYQSSISLKADANNPSIIAVTYDVVDHYVYADADKQIIFGGDWTLEEINSTLSKKVDGINPKDFTKVDLTMLTSSVSASRKSLSLANSNTILVSSNTDLANNKVESLFLDEADDFANK